jgi:hypothetical protein
MRTFKCSSCDRSNIVRSYCYFVQNQEYFCYITEEDFTLSNFITYAMEMELELRAIVACSYVSKHQLREYWSMLLAERKRFSSLL